jgi:hypothetical protein
MEVLILDPPYIPIPIPVFSPPSTVLVHKYCCIRSGIMTLAMKLDSNNVVESEAFHVFYEVNNQSTCRVPFFAEIIEKVMRISYLHIYGCSVSNKD